MLDVFLLFLLLSLSLSLSYPWPFIIIMAFFTSLFSKVSRLMEGDDDEEQREQQLNKESHRYESFAPVRHGAQVKHYVDGQEYCW
jgi:hypothetical protein